MFSSRFFWKFFLSFAALHAVVATVFFAGARQWYREQSRQRIENRLLGVAELVRSRINAELPAGPNAPELGADRRFSTSLIKRIGETASALQVEVSVIAENGNVIVDSRGGEGQLGAQNNQPEIVEAAHAGRGVAERFDPAFGDSAIFVAIPISEGGKRGFVRSRMSTSGIARSLNVLDRIFGGVFVSGVVVAFLLSLVLSRSVIQPLERLTECSVALGTDPTQTAPTGIVRNDELGEFACEFDAMRDAVASRFLLLRENSEKLMAILGGMEEGVLAVDAEERVILANEASSRLLGFLLPDPTGRLLVDVARFAPVHEAVRRARVSDLPQAAEFRLPQGGRLLALRATQFSGGDSSKDNRGVVLVLRDVTDMRRLETMRSDFVANVSHELKTPLAAIQAYAETLQLGAIHDPEANVQFISRICEQADRLHQLILDLLQLARIESEQDALELASVDVAKVVALVIEDHQGNAAAKSVTVESPSLQASNAGPTFVNADEEGLRTILDNLISNAIKYTPANGRVAITYGLEEDEVLIEVIDTGVGIPSEHHQRVFERFYRVDRARSRELGGTGLGLSIVKHLVQAFGGTVGLESAPGEGSRFFMRFPAAEI